MDDAIGAVLERLRNLGIADNTVVIFSGDHGPSVGGKFTSYQRGVRIPCVCRWKAGIPGGRPIRAVAQTVDLLPTLLDMAGAKVPEDMVVDGQSLLPLMTGDRTDLLGRDDLYFEFGYTRAVRTDRWKYIAWRPPRSLVGPSQNGQMDTLYTHFGRPIPLDVVQVNLITASLVTYPHYFDPDQLYDLENDPREQVNLAGRAEFKGVLRDMKDRLSKYLKTFEAPFPLDTPDPFFASPRYGELKAAVQSKVSKERSLWEADMRFIGFEGTERD